MKQLNAPNGLAHTTRTVAEFALAAIATGVFFFWNYPQHGINTGAIVGFVATWIVVGGATLVWHRVSSRGRQFLSGGVLLAVAAIIVVFEGWPRGALSGAVVALTGLTFLIVKRLKQ